MHRDSRSVRVKVGAEFSFFAVLGFLICTDKDGVSVMCLCACMLHELGHLVVMYSEHRPPESITFRGGGIHISGGSTSFLCTGAGVAVNIALFLLCGAIPWEVREVRLFGVVNLLIAAFNLLPVGTLDGKLMLDKAITAAVEPERAVHISSLAEKAALAFVLPAVVMLVFSGALNFSAVIFLIYVLSVEILEKI